MLLKIIEIRSNNPKHKKGRVKGVLFTWLHVLLLAVFLVVALAAMWVNLQGRLEQEQNQLHAQQRIARNAQIEYGRLLEAHVELQTKLSPALRHMGLSANGGRDGMNPGEVTKPFLAAAALFQEGEFGSALQTLRARPIDLQYATPVFQRDVVLLKILCHYYLGHWDSALSETTAALEASPEHPPFHQIKAALLLELGKPKEALMLLAPLAEDPANATARLLRGNGYWQLREFERARVEYRGLLGSGAPILVRAALSNLIRLHTEDLQAPEAADLYMRMLREMAPRGQDTAALAGHLMLRRNNLTAAQDLLARANRMNPADTHVLEDLLALHQRTGDEVSAENIKKRLLEILSTESRNEPRPYLSLREAFLSIHQTRLDEAQTQATLQAASPPAPVDQEVHAERRAVRAHLKNGDFEEALRQAEMAEERGIIDGQLLCLKSQALIRQENIREADRAIASALSAAPSDPEVLVHAAIYANAKGDRLVAEKLLLQALEYSPTHANAIRVLACTYQNARMWRQAQSIAQRGLSRAPRDTVLLSVMQGSSFGLQEYAQAFTSGKAYLDAGGRATSRVYCLQAASSRALGKDPDETQAYFRKAIDANPDDLIAINDYALFLADNEQAAEALPLVEDLLKKSENAGFALDTAGYVFLRSGDYPRADKLLSEALDKTDGHPDVLFHLALLQKRTGQAEKGQMYLQRTLRAVDQNPTLIRQYEGRYSNE